MALAPLALMVLLGGCVKEGEAVAQQVLRDAQRRRERASLTTPSPTATQASPTETQVPTRTPRPGRSLANVRRVWDGNTILIDGGLSVRYIGVDTPGAGMFRRGLEPFGREAA